MKRVAVYSGTFDPVHSGHAWLVQYVLNERAYDELILLIEPRPRHKPYVSSLADRVAMARLAFSDEPRVSINPFEDLDDQYTLQETLQKIRAYTGEAEIALVMGGDVFEYVPQWDGIDVARKELSFIVALRSEDDGEIAVGLMSDEFADVPVHLVASIMPGVSSSAIRAAIANDTPAKGLEESVYAYINENGLYTHEG